MKKYILLIIVIVFASCKPKEVIVEKTVTKVDSTLNVQLKQELEQRNSIIENLKSEIERQREENTKLKQESTSHTINYDTDKPIDENTGKHPVKSETTTQSKSVLDKIVSDFEKSKEDYNSKIESYTSRINNLELALQVAKNENSELKKKTTPINYWAAMFIFVVCFLMGAAIGVVMRGKLRR